MTVRELLIKVGYETDEKSLNKAEGKISNFKENAKKIALGVVAAVTAIGIAAVKAASDMEDLTAGFEVMLGSAEKAADLMEDLKEFSATTPFQLQDLAKGTQNLISFGVPAEQAVETLRRLGDTAGGNVNKLNGLILAYGKVQAKGKASMEEITMMAERGIPIMATLQDQLGVTEEEFFKLVSAGKIGREEISTAFQTMTSEGGMFFEGMKKASMTFSGMVSTMKDNITLVLAEIGSKLLPTLKVVVDQITKLFQGGLGQVLADLFDAINPIITQLTDLIIKLMTAIQPVLSQIIKSLIPIIDTVLTGIINVIDILMPSITAVLRLVGKIFELLMPLVDAALKPMLFVFEALATLIEPFLTMLIELLEKILYDIFADMSPTINELTTIFMDLFRMSLPFIKIMAETLAFIIKILAKLSLIGNKVFFKVFAKGLQLVARLLRPLVDLLDKTLLPIMEKVLDAWDQIMTFIDQAINKFIFGIVNMVSTVFDVVNTLIDKLNAIPGVEIEQLEPIDTKKITETLIGDTTTNTTNINMSNNITMNGDISNKEQMKQGLQKTAQSVFQIELQKVLIEAGY